MRTTNRNSSPYSDPQGAGRSIGMAVWGVVIVALVFFGLGFVVDALKDAIAILTGIFVIGVCTAVLVVLVYLMFRGLPLPAEISSHQNVVPDLSPRQRHAPPAKPAQSKGHPHR